MSGPRTSQTHPLQIAEVRMSPAHGRIGITFCPGKQDSMASTGAWARDLATDIEAIAAWGARLVLTLVESLELRQLKVPGAATMVRQFAFAGSISCRSTRFVVERQLTDTLPTKIWWFKVGFGRSSGLLRQVGHWRLRSVTHCVSSGSFGFADDERPAYLAVRFLPI